MDAQLPLILAGTELNKFLGTELPTGGVEPPGFPGFADITIDVPSGTLLLYWKGSVPAAVPGYLHQLEALHAIRTKILPARFSRAEFDAERNKILADPRASEIVNGMGPSEGYGGMLIEVDDPATAASNPLFAGAAQRLTALAAGQNPMVFRKAPKHSLMSRIADSSPWWGGARTVIPALGTACTSGFSVLGPNSTPYMLSAWHCPQGLVNLPVVNGSSQLIGVSWFGRNSDVSKPSDSSLIANIASNGNRIYTGGTGTGESSSAVVGQVSNFNGSTVCQSGMWSGEICGITVANVNFTCNYSGQLVSPCIMATKSTDAVSSGDSGGPVYVKSGSNVFAVGSVSGGVSSSFSLPCPGLGGTSCSTVLLYVDIGIQLSNEGVSLKIQ